MDVLSVLKTVGTGLLMSSPLGVAALPIINAFLPDEKQLNNQSTGVDAESAVNDLPASARESLLLAEINLKVEEEHGRTARYQAMTASDGQETRALLVMKAMNAMIWFTLLLLAFFGWVYVTKGAEAALNSEFIALFFALTGTYAYVIRAYFGDLRTETKSRHAAIDDKPKPALNGLAGLVAAVRG